MSELSGEHPWTDEHAGWSSRTEERIAPLRSAAFAGLVVGVLLLVVGAAWWQQSSDSAGTTWGPVICFVLCVGAIGWGGLAALAFWICRAVLAEPAQG